MLVVISQNVVYYAHRRSKTGARTFHGLYVVSVPKCAFGRVREKNMNNLCEFYAVGIKFGHEIGL